ncbi:MAG: DNA translocase FtsK 4TM domain-containing protein, partial [Deltaproteobacteria bacterium]|nr:DNA translocase FtsK 4TM domain-containing protein [Deltaproteobacteria bacterium]
MRSTDKKLAPKSKTRDKKDKPEHPIRKEIRGLILLVAAIILGGSLLSYHPADQLIWNVTGHLDRAHNLFGTVGAHLAGTTFFLIGFSSFWLIIILLALAFLSFRARPMSSPITNFIAALALIVSSSAILNLQIAGKVNFRGQGIESGGLVGLFLSETTEKFL